MLRWLAFATQWMLVLSFQQQTPIVVHPSLSLSSFASLSNEPRSTFPRNRRKFSLKASTTVITSTSEEEKVAKPSFAKVLWRFTRPHTIIGSALAIPALHALAAPSYAAALSKASLWSMFYSTIPALLMNLYITGLNQITDVEIDKINKPELPIAAGDLSLQTANITVLVSLVVSLVLGFAHPGFGTQGLNVALWGSGILGTLYSLEPFRLKRFPFLAAFCIVAVRGAVINAGFYAHAKVAAFGTASTVLDCLLSDSRCFLSSLYFAVFGIVIALMKDVPDVKGDALSNVRTFSVRLGPSRIFAAMHRLLTATFVGVGACFFRGALAPTGLPTMAVRVGRTVAGVSALLAGLSVQKEAAPVDAEDPKEVYNFYMHLWKLFYLSYLVLPLAR